MSASPRPDFTPIRKRFAARLELRLITICEHFVGLESEPRYRFVDALMREFHSLAGTAGTLGFDEISRAAAAAESICLRMMRRGRYDRRLDVAMLERRITEIGGYISAIG
ncbi:MAG TPA: Hpt domain-containing protein [Thermoanaerobaculia bacterium]|nr:Hpt domain-containing protein [Thermoanaerobaculia bacterium]